MNKAVLTALAASLMILNFFPTLAQQRDWANFGCYAEQNKTELLQLNKDDSRNIRMILQPITLALTIYGNWRWTHPKNGEKTQSGALKITTMDWLHRGFWAGMLIFVGMLWGLFLCKAPGFWTAVFPQADPHPYLDAYVTVAMLVAQYLAAKKHIETWVLWLLADASQIALYIMSGMAGLPVVSLAYLVLAIFGGLSWLTEYKKDSTAEIAAETLNRQNADEVTSDNNTTER